MDRAADAGCVTAFDVPLDLVGDNFESAASAIRRFPETALHATGDPHPLAADGKDIGDVGRWIPKGDRNDIDAVAWSGGSDGHQ